MKNALHCLIAAWILIGLGSCATSRKSTENDFYNKHNELNVQSKDGLFSSLHITFGSYTTGEKESGVDKNIIQFGTERAPFHFSLSDNQGNTTSVQAVYTNKDNLESRHLPEMFDSIRNVEIFYAWVRGGTINALKNWELMVKNPTYEGLGKDEEVGVFRSLGELITVHANNRFGSPGSYANMCYEFRLKGVRIAAVMVNGAKRVWLSRQLDKESKFALAGAIAAFLMR